MKWTAYFLAFHALFIFLLNCTSDNNFYDSYFSSIKIQIPEDVFQEKYIINVKYNLYDLYMYNIIAPWN